MRLLDLPTEIILSIADELQTSQNVFKLSVTNTALARVLLPAAYRFNSRHEGSSILHWTIRNNKLSLARTLIERCHADINIADNKGQKPIFIAIRRQNKDIVDLLLSQEIDLQTRTQRRGFTPLLYAAYKGSSVIVEALINKPGIKTIVYDNEGRSALWYTVCRGMRTAIQQLCQAGGDINKPDLDGVTPLKLAILKKDIAMVKSFLEHLSNVLHTPTHQVGAHTKFDQSSIGQAAAIGDGDIIRFLLDCGVNPSSRNEEGKTLLHLAATQGHYPAIKLLLRWTDIDPNTGDDYGSTPLHEAAINGHLLVVKLLLNEPGIDINTRDNSGATALWWATEKGHYQVAKRLLAERDVDVNVVGEGIVIIQRTTSLHHGVQHEDEKLIRLLLEEKSTDPNIADGGGKTPLAWAAVKGNVNIVNLLLKHKYINVNAPEKGNPTPLGLAAGSGHVKVVKGLLAHSKLNINESCEHMGGTALLLAARKGYANVVDIILRDGRAEPNCADYLGRTALWWAAYNGHTEVAKRLVQSCRVKNDMAYHSSPLSAAIREGHWEIAQLLRPL